MERKSKISPFGRNDKNRVSEGFARGLMNASTDASTMHLKRRGDIAYDLVCFGVLMVLSGMGDLYIIVANPQYRLPFFGMKPEGWTGLLIKSVHPFFHFGAGFGAIYGKKWAYPLMMVYSAYGLINAMVNRMLLPGPHRIRTVFMIGTSLVMVYLYLRRDQFRNE